MSITSSIASPPSHNFPLRGAGQPLIIAHRGGAGLWPENTLYAFERAIALGIEALETDAHLSADGVIMLMHDPMVDRVSNGQGPARALSCQAIQGFDAGYWWTNDAGKTYPYRGLGCTIPSLEEVLVRFPSTRFTIDIKDSGIRTAHTLGSLLRRHSRTCDIAVGSFHNEALAYFREHFPEIPTMATRREILLLCLASVLGGRSISSLKAQIIASPTTHCGLPITTKKFIDTAHRYGLPVYPWTINNSITMAELSAWGVDGFITDFPDRAIALP